MIDCHVSSDVIPESSVVVSSVNDINPNAKAPRAKVRYHVPKPKMNTNREDDRFWIMMATTGKEEAARESTMRDFESSFILKT